VKNDKLTQELGNMLVDENYVIGDNYPDDYLTKFAALWERNDDIAGWIEIAGTQLNYPVVQAKNNSKYDRTDFDGNHNDHGVPFVDYRVDIKKPSIATILVHKLNALLLMPRSSVTGTRNRLKQVCNIECSSAIIKKPPATAR
jgi:hypothetical protein